jgi:hypothetical protein
MHIRIKTEVYCLERLIGMAIEAPAAAGGRSNTSSIPANYRWSAAKLTEDELDAKFSSCLTPSTILSYKKTHKLGTGHEGEATLYRRRAKIKN